MSEKNTIEEDPTDEAVEGEVVSDDLAVAPAEALAPAALGSTKYVHAAFFVVGIAATFVTGRLLAGIWNALAAWPAAVHAVPQLLLYGEDERPSYTIIAGVVAGIITVVQLFRNSRVREWSDDVAAELSKVVWPTRETVTNGTIVVIVASAIAAVYIGLLDRLWGFVTTLVYGA